ncbi:MAG: hypothetical protein Q9219_006130 [cf. Caloplaca sp. 3 TL-2023]
MSENLSNDYVSIQATEAEKEVEWREVILGIRRLQLYTRYADYLPIFLKELEEEVEQDRLAGWKAFQKEDRLPWMRMANKLKDERKKWKQHQARYMSQVPDSEIENHLEVIRACRSIGLVERYDHHVHAMLYSYAEKSEFACCALEKVIEIRHWFDLAEILDQDVQDIACLIPYDMEWLRKPLTKCLQITIRTMFQMREWEFWVGHAQSWPPTYFVAKLAINLEVKKQYETEEEKGARQKLGFDQEMRGIVKIQLDHERLSENTIRELRAENFLWRRKRRTETLYQRIVEYQERTSVAVDQNEWPTGILGELIYSMIEATNAYIEPEGTGFVRDKNVLERFDADLQALSAELDEEEKKEDEERGDEDWVI